jgi:ferrochelatase
LFSAHSIPQYISDKGDPYKKQIEESIKDIVAKSNIDNNQYTICYQSKVGRLKWLEPDIKSELLAAGARNEAVVVIPISFTSEHSETLVELDIEYAEMAKEHGIEFYRVPTLSSHNLFIETLAKLTVTALQKFVPDIITETETRLNLYCGAEMCCQRVNINAY